jgi:hypothetical protein
MWGTSSYIYFDLVKIINENIRLNNAHTSNNMVEGISLPVFNTILMDNNNNKVASTLVKLNIFLYSIIDTFIILEKFIFSRRLRYKPQKTVMDRINGISSPEIIGTIHPCPLCATRTGVGDNKNIYEISTNK